MKKIKVRIKELPTDTSCSSTSMYKLKKVFINNIKEKFLLSNKMIENENYIDGTSYAEKKIEGTVLNTIDFTKNVIKKNVYSQNEIESVYNKMKIQNKDKNLRLNSKELIGCNNSISVLKTEHIKIRLKLNYEVQKVYQKVYFIKQKQKLIRVNKKQIRKMEYCNDAPFFNSEKFKDYNLQKAKSEINIVQQKRNNIKQNVTYQSKSIKYKAPSYIKEREVVANDIKDHQQIQTKMKENYKNNSINITYKTKKVVSKTEKAKKIEDIIVTSAKKGLGTTITGAVGGLVIIIVLIIVMISSFLQTSVGFLFSDDSIDIEAGDISIGSAIEIIEQEVDDKVEEIKTEIDYDKLLIYGMTPYWKDILSIYAVLGSSRENLDITSMKEENIEFLRKVFWEVCEVDWDTTTYTVKHVYTVDGETVVEYEERVKLEITLNTLDLDEMVGKYSLSNKEHEQLMELQKTEYDEMWAKLLLLE